MRTTSGGARGASDATVLLERESALEGLGEALEVAAAGAGRVALVGGEAGIGKTSLVRAARDQAPSNPAGMFTHWNPKVTCRD